MSRRISSRLAAQRLRRRIEKMSDTEYTLYKRTNETIRRELVLARKKLHAHRKDVIRLRREGIVEGADFTRATRERQQAFLHLKRFEKIRRDVKEERVTPHGANEFALAITLRRKIDNVEQREGYEAFLNHPRRGELVKSFHQIPRP